MSEPYLGIPAGILLDEDLEEHMSEKKGLFDAAISFLRRARGLMSAQEEEETKDEIRTAIGILEAAGKVDKATLISHLSRLEKDAGAISPGIRVLLEALPDKEKP